MSLPALAVLYAGLVPKKWVVNTMFMAFTGLLHRAGRVGPVGLQDGLRVADRRRHARTTYTYHYGGNFFSNFFNNFVGHPETITAGQPRSARRRCRSARPSRCRCRRPALAYFQFVFAAITPLLFLGQRPGPDQVQGVADLRPAVEHLRVHASTPCSCGAAAIGPMKAPSTTPVATSSTWPPGTSGFVAAWLIGPRLARDRAAFGAAQPALVAVGAGILWLGWNGFNGGDPYFSGADAATAVSTPTSPPPSRCSPGCCGTCSSARPRSRRSWGAVNGMIVGLVAITPCAGYVSGSGAIWVGDHRLHDRVVRLDLLSCRSR